jgi:hypothetical protein
MSNTIDIKQFRQTKIPQTTPYRFANAALGKISGIKDDAETVVREIMGDLFVLINDEPGIDPILQCIVVDLLISDMSKIDPFFEENFAELQEIIPKNINQDNTNWMDIQDATVNKRAEAKAAIDLYHPKIQSAFAKTRLDRAEFMEKAKQFRPHFEWVGILIQNDKKWDCITKQGGINSKPGDLYILCQRSHQTVELVRIGQVSSDKVELRGNEPSLLQGAPVFLVQH